MGTFIWYLYLAHMLDYVIKKKNQIPYNVMNSQNPGSIH
jgi:hypothetical protein